MDARHRTVLLSGAAALLAAGLTATAAYAWAAPAHPASGQRATAATWSVSSSEDTESAVKTVLTDQATGTKIKCTVQFNYSFTQKMGLPSDIATVPSLSFSNCTLPGKTPITLTSNTTGLPMMALSFNRLRNLGVTTGEFAGIDISLSSPGCSGVLDGTAAGANNGTVPYHFYNNPDVLITGGQGNLHSYNVSGCAGLVNTGDAFTLFSAQDFGGLFITSP